MGRSFLGARLHSAAHLQRVGALDARTVHEDILAAVVRLCGGGGGGGSAASAHNEVGRGVGSVQGAGAEVQRCRAATAQSVLIKPKRFSAFQLFVVPISAPAPGAEPVAKGAPGVDSTALRVVPPLTWRACALPFRSSTPRT